LKKVCIYGFIIGIEWSCYADTGGYRWN